MTPRETPLKLLKSHAIFDSPFNPGILGEQQQRQEVSPTLSPPRTKTPKKSSKNEGKEELNPRPWPQITNILDVDGDLLQLLEAEAVAVTSEKLDGSNISINSKGDIFSRRRLLLRSATAQRLAGTRFGGNTMENLVMPLARCRKMAANFAKYFPFLNLSLIHI